MCGCLRYRDFKRLEYLLQMDEEQALAQFDSMQKLLTLCVYAPYPLVCQILPRINPRHVCDTTWVANSILHYLFLRDPFGDDPETNSIKKLLLTMGAKDIPNADGFTLADLQQMMRKG